MTARRMSNRASLGVAAATLLLLPGCFAVAVDPDAGFPTVSETVRDRLGEEIVRLDRDPHEATRQAIRDVLEDGLTAGEAVRVALVNNRDLQAVYSDLGVAQADLVQASLLHNPVLDAEAGFPLSGGGPVDLTFGLAIDVIDLVYVPLRKRVAEAAFEQAKLAVAGEVLDVAWAARAAFYEHQENEQRLEMHRQIAESTQASVRAAEALREAGNITALDLSRERALAEEMRLLLREAEISVRQSRESLNAVMGLWGADTDWQLAATRLPEPPEEAPVTEGLETRAVERSLDLASARHRLDAAARNVGLNRVSGPFPEILVGGAGEREGEEWESGPRFAIPLPLFDWGQARLARAGAELRRAEQLYYGLAVRVRTSVRAARERAVGHRERALHYRDVQLPLRNEVLQETQLQHNAMQLGVFELLRAKEEAVETGIRYVAALREYWLARNDLDLLLAGRLPPTEPRAQPAPTLEELPRFPFPALD